MPDDWLAATNEIPHGRQLPGDEHATLDCLHRVRRDIQPNSAVHQVVSLNAIVMAARETLRPEVVNRSVVWRALELGDVMCDPELMKQVFVNLLADALRLTRKCTPAVIQVGSFVLNGEQVVFVRDNSAGADARRDDNEVDGTGFAAAVGIIRGQGGRAWANADVASGATVYFTVQTSGPQQGTLPYRPAGH